MKFLKIIWRLPEDFSRIFEDNLMIFEIIWRWFEDLTEHLKIIFRFELNNWINDPGSRVWAPEDQFCRNQRLQFCRSCSGVEVDFLGGRNKVGFLKWNWSRFLFYFDGFLCLMVWRKAEAGAPTIRKIFFLILFSALCLFLVGNWKWNLFLFRFNS